MLVFLSIDLSNAKVLKVPQDYPTIQDGIDAAVNGDTVLVADGTYKGEGNRRISFLGKMISVLSEHGPEMSIIDGENSDSWGFSFGINDSDFSVLSGFTITQFNSSGLSCYKVSPTISNCIISKNQPNEFVDYGGGVRCFYSFANFKECVFDGNIAPEGGGGVYCSLSNISLTNCIISNNELLSIGGEGGGIFLDYSGISMTNCVSYGNIAGPNGDRGGFVYTRSSPNIFLSSCILWNDFPDEISMSEGEATITYSDIDGGWPGEGNIDADPLFSDPGSGDFTLQGESPCIDGGDPYSRLDMDSSVNDMGASGGTGSLPDGVFGGVISGTLKASESPYIVSEDLIVEYGNSLFIEQGVKILFHNHSGIVVYGDLSAEGVNDSIILFSKFQEYDRGKGIRFNKGSGSFVTCIVENNYNVKGGGLHCAGSSVDIANCRVRSNKACYYGGGIYIDSSVVQIDNSLISSNAVSIFSGGGIYCSYSDPAIKNCTITNNTSSSIGGIYCNRADPTITNCILWNNAPNEIGVYLGTPIVTYSDIQGNWLGEGNIDEEPLFRDPDNCDYHLQSMTDPDCGDILDSPCIDTGDPAITDLYLGCEYGLGSDRSDMGAYGGENEGPPVSVDSPDHGNGLLSPKRKLVLRQNHPNPFNPSTTISYILVNAGFVNLRIFDIAGRLVCTLVAKQQNPGEYSILWRGTNEKGMHVASGVYICTLTTGDESENKKMILLK